MRILIVDDERPARDRLRRLLAGQAGIAAVDEARDGMEALAKVASFQPDALLLDISMPGLSGLEVAASLPSPAPLVVFVTAHDDYALQAFDANAIDYLLKPCDPARLARALGRLHERLHERLDKRLAGRAVAPAPATGLPLRQLLVTERGVTRIVRIADIRWLETADNYVVLHDGAGAPLLRQTLAGLLAAVGPAFVRCHRRAAIHLPWVARIVANDKGDGRIELADGGTVPLSRQYRSAVLAALAAQPADG
ncbi:LytR/AlgR family response regulator transcription factor [Pseudoduganella lutea]|uniref:Response regulator n=1 Tax=Pseudoduganella lutea TaxID=321985 RepID=A0A4P6L2N6_9BURK|nr:response regulator [Pseudoduganella lutea]QBE65555.1 response regulator [Pseudoduganella lutea]